MFDTRNFSFRQTQTETVDVCFLYTEHLLCAMFTGPLNCVSDLTCFHNTGNSRWFSSSGFPHFDPEPMSLPAPFSLACSEGAQRVLDTLL